VHLGFTLVILEGTRDAIFLKYALETYMSTQQPIPKILMGNSRVAGKIVSGACVIFCNSDSEAIIFIPVPGISELKKLRETILNDISTPNIDIVDIPEIILDSGERFQTKIPKKKIKAVIFICDYDKGQDLAIDEMQNKESLSFYDRPIDTILIRHIFFKENLEEFLYNRIIKPYITEINEIIRYLSAQSFSLSKAVKAALFKYCDSIYMQYSQMLASIQSQTLIIILNEIIKLILL